MTNQHNSVFQDSLGKDESFTKKSIARAKEVQILIVYR